MEAAMKLLGALATVVGLIGFAIVAALLMGWVTVVFQDTMAYLRSWVVPVIAADPVVTEAAGLEHSYNRWSAHQSVGPRCAGSEGSDGACSGGGD
jgi:hypothetical protein